MSGEKTNQKSQIIYLSHGGGPLPILNDPSHGKMIRFMENLPSILNKPDSIIVFSAHWEEDIITIQSGSEPGIVYDYYGFPDAAYHLNYPCKGNSKLAEKVAELFKECGIEYRMDNHRAYDHGSYIPLMMMYPNADIPVIQVSLNHNLDPLTHLNIGKALRRLNNENILIIGSGFSFHNMRQFDFTGKDIEDKLNDEFQDSLIQICCNENDIEKRWQYITEWEIIPGARYCHPREEHLLPLFVCAGLSNCNGTKIFDDYILGKRAIAFLW